MSSINTDHVDMEKVTYFVLHVIYNRQKREKSPRDLKAKKKFAPTKSLRPDQKSLTMKILRAHLVSHSWVNCQSFDLVSHSWVNCQSFDPLSNGWIFVDGALQPRWYEGASLLSEEQIQNYL